MGIEISLNLPELASIGKPRFATLFMQGVTGLCWLLLCFGWVQAQPKDDKKAETLYLQGEGMFNAQNYLGAAEQFELIAERKFNRFTTPSIYMGGLCYFHLDEYDQAIAKFQYLINTYPASIYIREANYHKALMMVKRSDARLGGLYLLSELVQDTLTPPDLQVDARNAFRDYVFNHADAAFLEEYVDFVRSEFYPAVHEALCMRLYKEGRYEKVSAQLRKFLKKEGALSPRLKKLAVPLEAPVRDSILKVAVMLPLMAGGELQSASQWSLEWLSGMKLALERHTPALNADLQFRVFDTGKDVTVTRKLLREEVSTFAPDLFIGDLFNAPSEAIAEYAEQHKTAQIVPLSPVESLIKGRQYVFLANPSMPTAMKGFTAWAIRDMKVNRCLVIGDNSNISELQIKFVTQTLTDSLITHAVRRFTTNYSYEALQMPRFVADCRSTGYDAVVIASENESFVTFMLKAFAEQHYQTRILGTTDWAAFKYLSANMLSDYSVSYIATFYVDNDEVQYKHFLEAYQKKYSRLPGEYACKGYDITSFILLHCLSTEAAGSFRELLHDAQPYRGLVQNYYFGKSQDNQSLQILRYKGGKLTRVKLW